MKFSALSLLPLFTSVVTASDHRDPWEYTYDDVNQDLSYGAQGKVWSEDNHKKIDGWVLGGDNGHKPEMKSDRVILTPAKSGGKRASIWSEHAEPSNEWTMDFEFRATGPERGGGNLQIWYAKEGAKDIGAASVYTVGKFDGLAIVVSQYGGAGGSVRGFVNDGSTSYKDHHQVDRLAFGHCDIPYRNLGHFTHIHMRQTSEFLEVEVNHQPCFKSTKVRMPAGNMFGITAASADIPDSFETKAFIVSHDHHDELWNKHENKPPQNQLGKKKSSATEEHMHSDTAPNSEFYWIQEDDQVKDAPANKFKSESDRFQDIHDRLMLANHQMDALFHDLSALKSQHEWWQSELKSLLGSGGGPMGASARQAEMYVMIETIKKDLEDKDYRHHIELLANAVQQGHDQVMIGMGHGIRGVAAAASPRIWFFAFIIFCSQGMLLASYLIYKRRVENNPRKFL